MNKTRIWSGFSLVEMMLLLVITSLMLASGVTVISKKHVKVPKIAMHGAYMCYYKNGQLHQEQYVGSNLAKKIMDEDAGTECKFKPPSRASYLYIQATAGGGGGGDAGYKGGNLQVFESATEVMSPFGITQGLLDLKGISAGELSSLGGSMYAYANATGDGGGKHLSKPGGDAGDGGDLYYIKQECSTDCIAKRDWKYTGNSERICDCTSATKYSTTYTYNYSYDCSYNEWESCTGKSCDGCYRYKTESCSGPSCDHCYRWDGSKCTSGYNDTDYCESGYNKKYVEETCYSTCTNEYDVPVSAECSGSAYKNLTVETTDVYAQDISKNPPYRMDYKTGCKNCIKPGLTVADEKAERQVLRDQTDTYNICNYGNPSKFSGVSDGIFGSFFNGYDPVNVLCHSSEIRRAFGEDIIPMGGGTAAISKVETKKSSAVYSKKLEYVKTEELGLDGSYGTSCTNIAGGTCKNKTVKNTQFKNPVTNKTYPTTKSLATSCSYSPQTWTTKTIRGCSGKNTYGSPTIGSNSYSIYTSCSCVQNNSSGNECMYDYSQVKDENKRCMYIPQVVKGGKGGIGKQCRTNDVAAKLGITYIGNSDVVPGIRGSDKNCTGAEYQPLYTKAQWKSQPSCYAENGTDSQGSAKVTLDGDSCAVNVLPPTKGQGARKKATGGTKAEAGKSAPVDGVGRAQGTQTGNTRTGSCGSNHVGYCLTRKNGGTTENGKYTYKYTWNTNYLQYGEGGKAGGYNVKLIRSVKDGEYIIVPGRGGAGGAEGSGASGGNGGNTTIQFAPVGGGAAESILTILGGAGGPGGLVTPTEQLPTWYQGGTFAKGENGTPGETLHFASVKSNIMNLVLPVGDDNILNQWLLASGAGGNGGGSRNDCWASEWQRWFEGTRVKGNLGLYLDAADMENHACRKGTYWSSTPAAQDGISGVVVIRW